LDRNSVCASTITLPMVSFTPTGAMRAGRRCTSARIRWMTSPARRPSLSRRLAQDLPSVLGDEVQLQQVLLNLIVNAIEAMGSAKDRPRELTITSGLDGPEWVLVEVRDTGPGFADEDMGRVFEAFHTTKAEGLGIGLSISRSIIEAHGGRLSAARNEPHGAVFRFTLPVEEGTVA
jgi:signal transduction histidine kinase